MDLLARFVVPGSVTSVCRHRRDIEAALERIDLPFDRSVLAQALEMLDNDHPLPVFIEHRDFAPWNLKRLPGGQSGAIDWEWTALHGLPCQDIFRYFFIQDALFHGRGDVWQMLKSHALVSAHCRRFEIPPAAMPALAMNYLLRVLAMDWGSGNTPLANHSFRQVECLLESPDRGTSQRPSPQ